MRRRIASLVTVALLASLLPSMAIPIAAADDPPPPGTVAVHFEQITGPPAERMNLVILGDGYQHDEGWKFHRDVDRNLAVLWSLEPYRSYRNYMNVYLLEIVSQDTGVRCDPDDQDNPNNNFKVTPLRLWYSGSATSNGCVDPLARGTVYGPAPVPGAPCLQLMDLGCSGNQQHNMLMATYMTPLGVSGQNSRRWRSSIHSATAGSVAAGRRRRGAVPRARSSRSTSLAIRTARWPMNTRTPAARPPAARPRTSSPVRSTTAG